MKKQIRFNKYNNDDSARVNLCSKCKPLIILLIVTYTKFMGFT